MLAGKHLVLKNIMVVCLIFIVFVALAAVYMSYLLETQQAETERYLYEVAQQQANAVEKQIQGDMQTLESLALLLQERIESNGGIDKANIFPLLRKVAASEENSFLRMAVVTPDGNAIGYSVDGADLDSINYRGMEFLETALHGLHRISDTIPDAFSDAYINVYSVPLLYEGKICAAFGAVSRVDVLNDILNISTFGGKGFAHIVKGNGAMLIRSTHPNANKSILNIFDSEFCRDGEKQEMQSKMMRREMGIVKTEYQGEIRWCAYAPVKAIQDWYVFSVVPEKAINTKFTRLVFLTVCAVVFIALALFAFLLHLRRMQTKHQKTVLKLAYYDGLTGAYNRNKFNLELSRILAGRSHDGAVIVVNLNNFRAINEMFGVSRGNALLQYMAQILQECVGKEEFFARGAADTFYLYLRSLGEAALPERMMSAMNAICKMTFGEGSSFNVSLRCGIYMLTGINEDIDANLIIARAELALARITNFHTNRIAFYNEKVHEKELENNEIESNMYSALENGEFMVYLQPQYSVKKETLAGAEALVRWQSPSLGFVTPDRFIPLFEENGFATKLDDYVLEQVCRRLRTWIDAGVTPEFSVSVNQSRLHLFDKGYVSGLKKILEKYKIEPGMIQLEMTESAAIDNVALMVSVSQELHEAGFHVSMDDFGSGYSSLNVLKDVCVDELKLDKQFFDEASDSLRGRQIISSILSMADLLSIQTVAEGIERREQVEFLRLHKCGLIQGYYYARPMAMEDFEKLAFQIN